MKVYLVVTGYDYEGESVKGVFLHLAQAEACYKDYITFGDDLEIRLYTFNSEGTPMTVEVVQSRTDDEKFNL